MKKMKLFLLAAMIIGMGSAFTTTSVSKDGLWVKGPGGEAEPYDYAVNTLHGECDGVTDPACVYENEALTIPATEFGEGRFIYP